MNRAQPRFPDASDPAMTAESYQDLPFDITLIDTGYLRPGFAASYLVTERGRAAFVETGTRHSVPRLLQALHAKGLHPHDVDYVIVTHVHLDHAGGAGELMRHLPNARLIVHPRGARHMIDPVRLVAGTTAVYGEEKMHAYYGDVVPVSAERIMAAWDGYSVALNGRPLLFLDTPGHARHHVCVLDERSRGIFSGDTFGLSYRAFDTANGPFIFPTTTPVQFDPDAMHASIDRLMGYNPAIMYLTHFGPVSDLPRLASDLHHWVDRFVRLARSVADGGDQRHARLVHGLTDGLLAGVKAHGCACDREQCLELLEADVELNAQGLGVWLDSKTV